MANIIHKGDINHIFRIRVLDDGVAMNISTATTMEIKLEDEETGTTTTYTASLTDTGADGKFEYATEDATVLNAVGKWKIQGRIVLADGTDFNTKMGGFTVLSVLVAA